MTTTAEALEALNDPGKFEIMATRVLRLIDRDSKAIEHIGVNAAGKTIKNPVDGFCRVPGSSPPRYVMHQFATTARGKLKHKWLFEPAAKPNSNGKKNEEGDLPKAARMAAEIRQEISGANFVLWLSTNQQVDAGLIKEVEILANKVGIEVRILGQSRLRDALDDTPSGEWIRKEFLGIAAKRVSRELLQEFSKASTKEYAKEFLLVTAKDSVDTKTQRDLASRSGDQCTIVVGHSGSGKSVACFQLLAQHVKTGGAGLWLPGEIVAKSQTLVEAITAALQMFNPELTLTAGEDALRLGIAEDPLIFSVDDINRTSAPAAVLRKLVRWAQPSSDSSNSSAHAAWRIICPAWGQYWSSERDRLGSLTWLGEVQVAPMQLAEAVDCLRAAIGECAAKIADLEISEAAERLGRDPILLAMYGDKVRRLKAFGGATSPDDVIGDFISDSLTELASDGRFLSADYRRALAELANWMLQNKQLYPLWSELSAQMDGLGTELDPIRAILQQGRLARITARGDGERFEFRHDRLLEFELCGALASMLVQPAEHEAMLGEPYYADYLGRALARTVVSAEVISWVESSAPLSLIAAIRHFDGKNLEHEEAIIAAGTRWIRSAVRNRHMAPRALDHACQLLEKTNSPYVLQLTAAIADEPDIERARVANGDTKAGLQWFYHRCRHFPEIGFVALEQAAQRAREFYVSKIVVDLKARAASTPMKFDEAGGWILLAGFMQDPALGALIPQVYAQVPSEKLLFWSFWAGIHCAAKEPAATLDPLIDAWQALSAVEENHRSDRSSFGDMLRRFYWAEIDSAVIDYLVTVGARPGMGSTMEWVLHEVDHPSAVRFVNKEQADRAEKSVAAGHKYTGGLWFHDMWDRLHPRGQLMSRESLAALETIWTSKSASHFERRVALQAWSRREDVPALQRVQRDDLEFRTVLWRRAQLGDRTTIDDVLPYVEAESHWFYAVKSIWDDRFLSVTHEAMRKAGVATPKDFSGIKGNEDNELSELLREIPRSAAEPLLLAHWEQLKYERRFVQLALYWGSPEWMARVDATIAECPNPKILFEHVDQFFGYMTTGLRHLITMEHTKRLTGYLRYLSWMGVDALLRWCVENGYRKFAEDRIKPECLSREREPIEEDKKLRNQRKEYFPTDEELTAELVAFKDKNLSFELWVWFDRLENRLGSKDCGFPIIEEWLQHNPSAEHFLEAANKLSYLGRRRDIEWIPRWARHVSLPQKELAVADTIMAVRRRSLD